MDFDCYASNLRGTLLNVFGITPAASPGAPASGEYRAGELYVDSDVKFYKCTVSGNPGTWVELGTADIAALIHAATEKTQFGIGPILSDNDEFGIWDSVSSALRKVKWSTVRIKLDGGAINALFGIDSAEHKLSLDLQNANLVFAGPASGGANQPAFRSLAPADFPINVGIVPVGATLAWLTDSAPTGWLLCYGQAVSRTTYADLFAVIGTTFGTGDGSTTFNLPDMRGRIQLGQDDMGGASANRVTAAAADSIGGSGGAESVALTVNELASHTHVQNSHTHPQQANTVINAAGATAFGGANLVLMGGTTGGTVATNQNTGGGAAHNNMPPYLTVNHIIYAGA